jgi:hypothetical protein
MSFKTSLHFIISVQTDFPCFLSDLAKVTPVQNLGIQKLAVLKEFLEDELYWKSQRVLLASANPYNISVINPDIPEYPAFIPWTLGARRWRLAFASCKGSTIQFSSTKKIKTSHNPHVQCQFI